MEILNIKDWIKSNGEQFQPLEYNKFKKDLITVALRLKDDKIFDWINPIYDEDYVIDDYYFIHTVRIQKFHEDNIYVDLFIGFWDLGNALWLDGETEKLPINNIDGIIGERMSTDYTKHIKSQLKVHKERIKAKENK